MIVLAVMMLPLSMEKCFAQGDSLKIRKNQLALNVAPMLTSLMGGYNWTAKLGLMYKRNVCEKSNLRFGFYYISQPMLNQPQPYYRNYINDSTRRDYYNYVAQGERFQMNLGYEYVFGKRKLKHFVGADLTCGVGFSQYYHYADDIVIHSPAPPPSPGGSFETVVAHTDLGSTYSKAIYTGLSPFYGIAYPLGKRWAVSAQAGFDMALGFQTNHHYVSSGPTPARSIYLEFNIPAFVNDVSLVFRF